MYGWKSKASGKGRIGRFSKRTLEMKYGKIELNLGSRVSRLSRSGNFRPSEKKGINCVPAERSLEVKMTRLKTVRYEFWEKGGFFLNCNTLPLSTSTKIGTCTSWEKVASDGRSEGVAKPEKSFDFLMLPAFLV